MSQSSRLRRSLVRQMPSYVDLNASFLVSDLAMLNAAVAVLACLCLARCSPAESHAMRTYIQMQQPHSIKELAVVLASIEEKLKVLDVISSTQAKQSRRLEVLQDKLDRVETTMSLRLERAQLAADRLEHRLHMLQTSVQASLKEGSEKMLTSHLRVAELTKNLTKDIDGHRRILEKVNGAYSDTWRRSLLLENMMRDGLSVVNATRRELADGLRSLARRQRESRFSSADKEAGLARQIKDNTLMIDAKLQKVLEDQKRFLDSCQRVQQDDPTHVADVLDRLIDSLINKTAATFKELQNIQVTVRNHDARVIKLLSTKPAAQSDASCRRLETAFKNASLSTFKETELHQLTEKFVALTDRADAALQHLEAKMATMATSAEEVTKSDVTAEADRLLLKLKGIKADAALQHLEAKMATMTTSAEEVTKSDVTAEADRLLLKLKGIKNEYDSSEDTNWMDYDPKYRSSFYDDADFVDGDLMDRDKALLGVRKGRQVKGSPDTSSPPHKDSSAPRPPAPARPPHRRHLHKHPYDRGPNRSRN
ncbi:hypothetical protein NE865_10908 [Phthorimaea operculella]|nr:hypothetical protein NE865_10908 [Phthorimaea operculella]